MRKGKHRPIAGSWQSATASTAMPDARSGEGLAEARG